MTGEVVQAETWALVAAVALGIVHVSADSFSYKAQEGNAYTVGARDEDRPRRAMAGRLHRAARNFTENLALFVGVLFALQLSDGWGVLSLYGAWIWVGARMAYLFAYASGVPWTRTICWQVAMAALLVAAADIWV